MKKFLSILFVLFAAIHVSAQSPQVLFYGYIEEGYLESNMPEKVREGEPQRLNGVKVKVMIGEEVVHAITCRNTGFYAVLLNEGQTYHVVFEKEGYLPRCFELNTAGLEFPNDEATIKCVADVSLFKKVGDPNLDEMAKQPYARCKFDPKQGDLVWDMEYTTALKEKFASMMEPALAKQSTGGKKH